MQTVLPYSAVIAAPIGRIGFTIHNNQLVNLDLLGSADIALQKPGCAVGKEVAAQLKQYFNNANFKFNLPLTLAGTPFQLRVWKAMQKINVGAALSYGNVAQQLRSSARAVGNACRRNPIPIIVPCHRIVARTGLGGFNGARQGEQLAIKQWLLRHEKYDADYL